MKKAAIYARVSSDQQRKEGTIHSQVAELKRQIKAAGDRLVREYVDDGYSGAMLDRPAMNRLREDLKTDLFEVIYILNSDRIARDVAYQTIIVSEFLRHRKRFIVNGQDYVDNPENKFSLTVLGAVSELERAKIAERSRRGRQHRLNQGLLLSHGNHIFGYTYSRRTHNAFPSYAVNEPEAEIVRHIFETYAKGETGVRTIVRQLKERGVKTRHSLGQTQIKYMLRNETYTGTKYFNTMTDTNALANSGPRMKRGKMVRRDRSEWIGMPIPAIVPRALFEKARARLEHNRECYRNARGARFLSTLVWCGRCDCRCFTYNRRYSVERKNGTRLYQRPVYRCRTKGAGHNPEIDARILESCAFEMIEESMLDPAKLRPYLDMFRNPNQAAKAKARLGEIDRQIAVVCKQKERVLDLYASDGLAREEYSKRLRKHDDQIRALEADRSELIRTASLLQDKKTVDRSLVEYCSKADSELSRCDGFDTKRRFLLERVEKVYYHRGDDGRDQVRLVGFVPMGQGPGKEAVRARFEIVRWIRRAEQLEKARAMNPEIANI